MGKRLGRLGQVAPVGPTAVSPHAEP
jgi:hypothetical protein